MKVRVCQLDGTNPLKTLPLAAGLLVAAARGDPGLLDPVPELRILPGDHTVAEAAAECGQADVLALSLYPWNLEHSLEVARRVKAGNSSCLVVCGGPAVPRRPEAAAPFLRTNEALDILAFGEGEETFPDLLRAHADGLEPDTVPGIAYRSNRSPEGVGFTEPRERLRPPASRSPYLDGTFDRLLTRSGATPSAAILETNRGCPFRCAFCSRGHVAEDPIIDFPSVRVREEIEWIATRGVPYLYIVDCNFGIRGRDVDLARHVAELKRRTGSPAFCYAHLRKNAREGDLAIPEALIAGGVRTQVAFATQDFEEPVLRAVGRRNPGPKKIRELRRICHEKGIPTFDEILLGLPRQTYRTFVRTVVRAMSPLPDDTFFLYLCRVVENSEMARPEYRERHGVVTRRCVALHANIPTRPEIPEYEEIVIATDAMPHEDWKRAFRLGFLAVAAHCSHLLRALIRYVRTTPGLDLGEYLDGLCAWMSVAAEDGVMGSFRRTFDRTLRSIEQGGPYVLPMEESSSPPREIADALAILALGRPDEFYEEVLGYTRDFVSARGGPVAVVTDLVAFEAFRTPRFGVAEAREAEFRYDWITWVQQAGRDPASVPGLARFVFLPPPYASAPTPEEFVRLHLAAIHARGERGRVRQVAAAGRERRGE